MEHSILKRHLHVDKTTELVNLMDIAPILLLIKYALCNGIKKQ